MSSCPKCGREYGYASYQYCLDCGIRLLGISEVPTIRIEAYEINEQALKSAVDELFKIRNFRSFQFDARFERFLEWV